MIEFDVETTNLQHHGADPGELFLTAFHGSTASGDPTQLCPHPDERELIQAHLEQEAEGFRAWNAKFDLHVLKQAGYELPDDSLWHDAMVAAYIMDERTSAALKARGALLFGDTEKDAEKAKDAWLKEEAKRRRKHSKDTGEAYVEPNFSDVPDEIMHPYAAQDVQLQRRIADVYYPAIEDHPDFKGLYELEMDVMRALFWAEDRGIPFDRDALIGLEAALLPRLDELEEQCRRIAQFDNFNPGSPKQISEALDRLNADVRYMTRNSDTGLLVTDRENLEACDHPLAESILAYRGEHKLYAMLRGILHTGSNDSKFPSAYLTSEDRVHPNFRQVGAATTGRMSCSNPNIQQVHRDDLRLRYAVAAGPGKKLVTCDLDSIELRLAAAFAGEGVLRDTLLKGGDLHQLTADGASLRGRRRTTGAWESPRAQGKTLNYSILFGIGVRGLRKKLGTTQKEATRIKSDWYKTYPEIADLQNRIEFALEDRGWLKSPLTGRRWRVRRDWSREAYKFLNYLIQGTAADVIKIATARCHKEGVPIVAVIHDEIIAEPDAADAAECARVIERAMTEGFDTITEQVPFEAEAQIVDRWSEAKDPDYVPPYMGTD